MVRRILNILHQEVRGLHQAAYFLGFFALLSAILALLRDRLLASYFGAGETLDIYYAAFRIPDLLFVSIASIVSIYVLIPFLNKEGDTEANQRRFIGHIISAFSVCMGSIGLLLFFLVPSILPHLFPGLVSSDKFSELVLLTRILLVQPILLGLSNIFASVTQVYGRFVLYGIAPLVYNLGIIVGILFFYPYVGFLGLGYGVLLGALLHVGIQLPFISAQGFLSRLTLRFEFEELYHVVKLSLPRTIALFAQHIALLALLSFASLMAEGSITVFNLSFNLQAVPLAIIGASYSVAAFPTLARLFSRGEEKEFMEHILVATRHIIFWSTPIIILFIVLRAQIVRVVLGGGEFDWADTRLTAAMLALFSISLLAQGLILLFVRGYYATGRTRLPLVVNLCSALFIVLSAYIFVQLFQSYPMWRYFFESLLRVEDLPGTEALMLPFSFSLGMIVNALLFWFFFERESHYFSRSVARVFFEVLSASVVMGFVTHQFLNLFDNFFDINTFWGIFAQGFFSGILGIATGIVLLKLLRNQEIEEVKVSLRRKLWSTGAVGQEGNEL